MATSPTPPRPPQPPAAPPRLYPDRCLTCAGLGAVDGPHGLLFCEVCVGTGQRYPVGGDLIYAGNPKPIGNLDWIEHDDGSLEWRPSIAPEYVDRMPPRGVVSATDRSTS